MNKNLSFTYQFQVPFHEVDRAGVLFFAHIFTHAHDAYEKFMAHLGLGLGCAFWIDSGYHLPIVHADADYKMPFHHGVMISVNVSIVRLGHTSFTTAYAFNGPDNQCYASVQIVHCCVDAKLGQVCVLPAELSLLLNSYQP